jgi:RNA polymerase primary sigma factor
VTANLRFVISYVKKYQGHGLDLSELVAIGNEGLLRAVKKFDPEQGVKFISYAVWWVRQAVLKALAEQTRSVRIPLNQNSQLIRMVRAQTYLAQELGREPTDNEVARALDDSVGNVRNARRMTAAELSLDAPIDRSDKDAATFGERFAGHDGFEIEEGTDGRLMREFIDRIFNTYLTPRESKILYLYYGLEEGSEGLTLEKIGALMGVTRERIRQIRERAFEKLRECPQGKALMGFWRAA